MDNQPTDSTTTIHLESREHLWSSLSEAAELEHVLMCCYLYSIFSLKRPGEDGLNEEESLAVERWRGIIRGVALEEMTHLTLVANIMSAVGGQPHFNRLNFPIPPGPFPDDMVVQLAPFDMAAVEHFIFVERPEHMKLQDGAGFESNRHYSRAGSAGRLMPFGGDYHTVGQLYHALADALQHLADEIGEDNLFCGPKHLQIGPSDSPLPGLAVVKDLSSALKAIDTIVQQGEGAKTEEGSHFARFSSIKREYDALLKKNPEFKPARAVVRNPVMRPPPSPDGKVWVNHPISSQYMDLANSIYIQMLRVLIQVYSQEERGTSDRKHLLNASFALMRALGPVAEALTHLPCSAGADGEAGKVSESRAGMSFAMVRGLTPLESSTEKQILAERTQQILARFKELSPDSPFPLDGAGKGLEEALVEIMKLPGDAGFATGLTGDSSGPAKAAETNAAKASASSAATAGASSGSESSEVQTGESDDIKVFFNTKRCIHARHCVTEKPKVFKANTPGDWIFPDQSDVESLTGVIRTCPSGAITYARKDGGTSEAVPDVNLIHIRENGPYAVLADIRLPDKPNNYRAVLCRCGQSENKPFCDNSHIAAEFKATGEPPTGETEMLEVRDGALDVRPLKDGPYQVEGNLEICAGTGRVVERLTDTRLCRCGQSKNKPFCDSSHVNAGFKADGL